jgi:hypothetical protein
VIPVRHELISPAQALRSWLRVPLEAWKSASLYSASFVLRIGRGLASGLIPYARRSTDRV